MAQAPEHPEDRLPPELERRLRELYWTEAGVPPALDEAILSAAHKRLGNVHRFRVLLRWGGAAAAAAVAASIMLAIWRPWNMPGGERTPMVASSAAPVPAQLKYTILDAYRIALELKAGRQPEARWDVNHDGVVDRKDVDEIAQEAVRLQ